MKLRTAIRRCEKTDFLVLFFFLFLLAFPAALPAATTPGSITWTDSIDEQWEEGDPSKVVSYRVNYKVPLNKDAAMQYYVNGVWLLAEAAPESNDDYGIVATIAADQLSDTNRLAIRYDDSYAYFFTVQAVDARGMISDPSNEVASFGDPSNEAAALGVSEVIPGRGIGGTSVQINGSGFQEGASLTFDGVPATDVAIISETELTCTVPMLGNFAGEKPVDVVVTVPDPTPLSSTLSNGFNYMGEPTISGISPDKGSASGGTSVTITGTNFFKGADVTFGGTAAGNVTVISETQLTCTSPEHSQGIVDVAATNDDGQRGTSVGSFEFVAFGIQKPTFPASVQTEDSLGFQATGSVSGNYSWEFSGGRTTSATGSAVYWDAPATVAASPTAYTVTVFDPDNPALSASGTIQVYERLTITNKPSATPTIQPGEVSDTFLIADGSGSGEYEWSVTTDPSGTLSGEWTPADSYTFTAPSDPTKPFAGIYEITVRDMFNASFQDTITVKVPLKITPRNFVMLEDAQDLSIRVQGAPAGTWFSITQYDLNRNIVTGDPGSGTFKASTKDSPDEIIPYDPEDIDDIISFTAKFSAAPSLPGEDAELNEVESGIYRVIPLKTFGGGVQDRNGLGINGATVSVIGPESCAIQTQTSFDGVKDGSFSFNLPAAGGPYQCIASAENKVPKEFTLTDPEGRVEVRLEDAADDRSYISGTISPADVSTVSAYYENIDGDQVLAGSTASNKTTGDYRIDTADLLTATELIVTASRPGLAGSRTFPVGTWPITGADVALADTSTSNMISATTGGVYENGSVRVVLPPNAVENNVTLWISLYDNVASTYASGSGDQLYEIDAIYQTSGLPVTSFFEPILITIPFDLSDFVPGDFESGRYLIRHAADRDDLVDGVNIKTVDPGDIVGYDPIGNGTMGTVTFRVTHLSLFGVGLSSSSTGSSTASSDVGDDGGGGGGCFIATAAYGSPLDRHVQILSEFRDRWLLPYSWGKRLVGWYYRVSPGLVCSLEDNPGVLTLVRAALLPLVGFSYLSVAVHPAVAVLTYILLMGLFVVGVRKVGREVKKIRT